MRCKLLGSAVAVAFFFLYPSMVRSQNCIPTGINGTVINLSCNQACTDLNFQIPHIKGTSDYVVSSIAFNPYPFTLPTSNELPGLYADDVYSPVVNMPFSFCFYDSIFNNCVVGSNGLLTFDLANAAPCGNSYQQSQPIPYSSANICSGAAAYYPRSSVMGMFTDLYPVTSASPPDKKIGWHVEGSAPCRKFVLNYYHVGMFGAGTYSAGGTNCNSQFPTTLQIVLHESTGIIEVFILQKNCDATSSFGANAILGLQDWTRTKAVWAPNKNATVWNESNTGYRFTPSGAGSRYSISQLYTLGGALVATADTTTTVAGMLDLEFPNVCVPSTTNTYVLRTTFTACDNPAIQLITNDTITVNITGSLNATGSGTNTGCGAPSGTITITVPPGSGASPYTYVLDGGIPVIAPSPYTFNNVGAGLHTIIVTDATGSCTSTVQVTVGQSGVLTANANPTATTCAGANNGTISVIPTGGTAPFTFTLNPGGIIQTGNTALFTNLPANTYTISVTDAAGCTTNPPISVTVNAGAPLTANVSATATSCSGASNGTISVIPNNGTGPYTFTLNPGGIVQTGNTALFTNLAANTYSVNVTDVSGCATNPPVSVTVVSGTPLTANVSATATSCNGASNGTITVTPNNGTAPFSFSLDGGTPQTGPPPYVFNNVAPGMHTIIVTDASGCVTGSIPVNVAAGPNLSTTVTKTDVLCNGGATGTITVTQPSMGTPPFEYSINGGPWQTSTNFTGLAAATYTVSYREANGCQGSQPVTIAEPAILDGSVSSIPATCNGQGNGTITVTASGGVSPYQYSINGGANWQSSPVFQAGAGSYTVLIRDANNCSISRTQNISEPAVLTASASLADASCDGGNDGSITVMAAGGNSNYQYSINGGTFQSSNVFNVAPGLYTITVLDNLGCTTSFDTTVNLSSNLVLTPQSDPTICESQSVQLQVNSNATSYSWQASPSLSNLSIPDPVANPTVTTQYIVTATLGACSQNDTVIVNVNAAPVPDAGPPGLICYGQTYTLQGSGGTQYNWSPTNFLSSGSIANPVSSPAATITYTLSVIDANGCSSLVTDDVTIDVTPPIKVYTFPYDTVAHPGDTFRIRATSIAPQYQWSPSIGLSSDTIANPMVTVGNIGDDRVYRVTAFNAAGCKGEGYVRVRVYKGPELYIPTAFTPNNDGKNDRFVPFPVGVKKLNYFRVYNRWGQVIYTTNELHRGWDGTFGGKEQPSGVYVWMAEGVTLDNRVISHTGTVVLIR